MAASEGVGECVACTQVTDKTLSPGCRVAGCCRVGLPGCRGVAGCLPGCRVCRVPGLPGLLPGLLPGAAGCCRVAGLPGCRVAGRFRVRLSGLLPGLCSGCQVGDSVKQ